MAHLQLMVQWSKSKRIKQSHSIKYKMPLGWLLKKENPHRETGTVSLSLGF